jgi:hypothetical protein
VRRAPNLKCNDTVALSVSTKHPIVRVNTHAHRNMRAPAYRHAQPLRACCFTSMASLRLCKTDHRVLGLGVGLRLRFGSYNLPIVQLQLDGYLSGNDSDGVCLP